MKKYFVAALVLVLAGLVGTFFGQMTNVPTVSRHGGVGIGVPRV
jgi:hypothetical protein